VRCLCVKLAPIVSERAEQVKPERLEPVEATNSNRGDKERNTLSSEPILSEQSERPMTGLPKTGLVIQSPSE